MRVKTEYLSPCVSADIEDLPPAVQEKLFDEVLDRDVQKGTHVYSHVYRLAVIHDLVALLSK